MGKLLSWVALIALGYLAFRLVAISQRRRAASRQARQGQRAGSGAREGRVPKEGAANEGGEMMVQCAHCGVFLPASDALIDGQRAFCDRAHRDAERAGKPRE